MSAVSNTISNWSPAGLVDALARGVKSIVGPAPEYKKSGTETWVEISPYGFLSANYMRYVAGNFSGCSFLNIALGNRVIKFKDGSMMVETPTGHLVELDKRRRVILVRVSKSEAEGAKFSLKSHELNDCFKSTVDKNGKPIVVMPGNIIISEDDERIAVTLPDGVEVSAKKVA